MRSTDYRSKIATNGQIVIPKALREALGLGPGDVVCFQVRRDKANGFEVVIKKAPLAFPELVGQLSHLSSTSYDDLFEDQHEKEREEG